LELKKRRGSESKGIAPEKAVLGLGRSLGSGSTTYVLGNIVADNLTLGGTSGISMDLNPTVAFSILKATLLPERNY
jgi:hypothetical protein